MNPYSDSYKLLSPHYIKAASPFTYTGKWDGKTLTLDISSINVCAQNYQTYEIAADLPRELERTFKESARLQRIGGLLPWLPPVIRGMNRTEDPITTTATTAAGIAEVVVDWVTDRILELVGGEQGLREAEEYLDRRDNAWMWQQIHKPIRRVPGIAEGFAARKEMAELARDPNEDAAAGYIRLGEALGLERDWLDRDVIEGLRQGRLAELEEGGFGPVRAELSGGAREKDIHAAMREIAEAESRAMGFPGRSRLGDEIDYNILTAAKTVEVAAIDTWEMAKFLNEAGAWFLTVGGNIGPESWKANAREYERKTLAGLEAMAFIINNPGDFATAVVDKVSEDWNTLQECRNRGDMAGAAEIMGTFDGHVAAVVVSGAGSARLVQKVAGTKELFPLPKGNIFNEPSFKNAAAYNIRITEQEGFLYFFEIQGKNGIMSIAAIITKKGNRLRLDELDIFGAGAGSSSISELRHLARQMGKMEGVDEVVITGGKRSTGAKPGKIPREIIIKVGK